MRTFKPLAIALAALGTTLLLATPTAVGASSPPTCPASRLVVWTSANQGALGTIYWTLDFTNQSGSTCTLPGYPKVSAVNVAGHRLGSAAVHDTTHKVSTVTLSKEASAITMLAIVNAGNFPTSKCGPADAAGVRVTPPNGTASRVVPFPFKACTKTLTFMRVQAVRAQ
jgi:Protein of unknown function (DUF4232)